MVRQDRYDRKDIRRLNAVSVLNQLKVHGALSRANIASRLGLTRATVSSIVAELIAASFVLETDFVEGQSGRPGLLLRLNPHCGSIVAVEIDVDCISVMLTDFGQERLWVDTVLMSTDLSVEEGLAIARGLVDQALVKSKERGLCCLGIGVAWAGLVNRDTGQLVYGPTSRWEDVPLKEVWSEAFGVPVFVENEAHAAAVGAFHFDNLEDVGDLIYLSLGVGLGAGIIVNGNLLRGGQGYAGQVGHTPFAQDGHPCSCGKRGCWISEVGSVAVLRKLSEAGVELDAMDRAQKDWIDRVNGLAESGDERVLEVLREVGLQIGRGMTRLVDTFNPTRIIIGGRLGRIIRFALPAVESVLKKDSMHLMGDALVLSVSESEEDSLLGCVASVFDAVMNNPKIGEA